MLWRRRRVRGCRDTPWARDASLDPEGEEEREGYTRSIGDRKEEQTGSIILVIRLNTSVPYKEVNSGSLGQVRWKGTAIQSRSNRYEPSSACRGARFFAPPQT